MIWAIFEAHIHVCMLYMYLFRDDIKKDIPISKYISVHNLSNIYVQ